MPQLDMFDSTAVNIPDELDPENYAADRAACVHPTLSPLSAYTTGCRCRGCYKFASAYRARSRKAGGPLECVLDGCNEPRRRKQGARYCEKHATCRDYALTGVERPNRLRHVECKVCGQMAHIMASTRYDICGACRLSARNLCNSAANHHVDEPTLVGWVKNPECSLCARRLYVGKLSVGKGNFAIDHAHDCCSSGYSCGKCIRGLLCVACNTQLGAYEALLGRSSLRAVVAYLTGAPHDISP